MKRWMNKLSVLLAVVAMMFDVADVVAVSTWITSKYSTAIFAPINPGDCYLIGNTGNNIVEVVFTDGNHYRAQPNTYGDFVLRLPTALSAGTSFQIVLKDVNNVLVETIDVSVLEGSIDVQAPVTPSVEQEMQAGQSILSGYAEPNTIIQVMSSLHSEILIKTDSSGYYYHELTDPLTAGELLSITAIDLAGNVSDTLSYSVDNNDTRPPRVTVSQAEGNFIQGEATPSGTVLLHRWSNGQLITLSTTADAEGRYLFNVSQPLVAGETITLYEAMVYAQNSIILSEMNQHVIQ